MSKLQEELNRSKNLFFELYGNLSTLKLSYFHLFFCPVAISEAMVKEHIVEDFDALELLVLRLVDAGFCDAKDILSISGFSNLRMIERALYNEIYVYHHIEEDGSITEMGRKTLEENSSGNFISHTMYDTPRRLQIEAATGTVIPSYLEIKVENMKTNPENGVDHVVPKEFVQYDDELKREINERISEYTYLNILNEGETIVSINSILPKQMVFRKAYLVMFEGMSYPMVVMNGYKRLENVGKNAIKKKDYNKRIVCPLAISFTDAQYFEKNGIIFDNVIVRDDSSFEYLREQVKEFSFVTVDEELDITDNEEIFEDEKGMDTEVAEEETVSEEQPKPFESGKALFGNILERMR